MGVLRKKTIIREEHNETGKTPVQFGKKRRLKNPARRRKIKKWAIATALFLVLGVGAYFGVRAYNAIKGVFAGDTGILNLLGGSQGQMLKGEVDGRVNVLLLGIGDEGHAGNTLADTIIVASYDTASKSVSMISIPRDTYVQIPNNGYAKINSAHAYGEQQQEGTGPDTIVKVVEEVSGLPIHYYARVDFTGLSDIVDALGGVTVDVENSFCDYGYTRAAYYNPVCFDEGTQTMDGETALKYARSRKASGKEGSDFARAKRQQNLLIAMKEKALSTETTFNPGKVFSVLEALGNHIKTSVEMNEIARIYELARGVDTNAMIQKNLDPTTGLVAADSGAAGYILVPTAGMGNYDDIHEFFRNVFEGVAIAKENAKLSFLNGTWSTWNYTNLYDEMETSGYNIVEDGGTKIRNYTTTEITDYTNGGKPETVRMLEEKFGVTAKKAEPTTGQSYEIKVILGTDYNN
ncbi:MAG: LCP family protein [Patescibacteria group bacterium]|nr:LCP family protein [Patescibacteria group bacterium]